MLRLISGLEEASRGTISIDGRDVTAEPPSGRGLAMVFQSYALYPHMTVAENMGFALKTAGAPRTEIAAKVGDAARILKLEALLDRRPKDLSGGQRQRVAIGRSIVREPSAFLFDEPLSNLDAALRVDMRFEIAKLHQSLAATMVYVTHDQVEAMTLADKIVVLNAGQIEQAGSPRELYERPVNRFVAQFIGSPKMNVLPVRADGAQLPLPGVPGAADLAGMRPEHIGIAMPNEPGLPGRVEVSEYVGADTIHYVDCGGFGTLTVRQIGSTDIGPGSEIVLQPDPSRVMYFNADGLRLD